MKKLDKEYSSALDYLRKSLALRVAAGIGAISILSACGSNQNQDTIKPDHTQSQSASPTPSTAETSPTTEVSESGLEAINKIATYSIKGAEEIVGSKLEKSTAYLEGNTDILQGTQLNYYYSEVYSTGEYNRNKSALENGLQDAIAAELLVYLTETPDAVQELLDRKQLSLQDVVYLHETYADLVPKLQKVEKEANTVIKDPKLIMSEAPMIHGVLAKSGASLLALSRIAELHQQGKITLLDSDACKYDATKDYTNNTIGLEPGDGFITIDPSIDPSTAPFFETDRFNPYYLNLTSVGTFGVLQTERAMGCDGNVSLSAEKMLLPYYAQLGALDALSKVNFRISNYPKLSFVEFTLFKDVLKLNPNGYVIANTYKEN